MKKPTSYLLHDGILPSGDAFIVVATVTSSNRKTGNMIQIAIMLKDHHPVAVVQSGLDAETICRDCPFAAGNGCYVNVGQAPASIWKSYQKGNIPFLRPKDYTYVFVGRKVRFGSYGNPTLIPLSIVKSIASICDGWTGYYHNWQSMEPKEAKRWNTYFMASTETKDSLAMAEELKLRTFHVSPEKPDSHIECLSDSHGIECSKCLLCVGGKNAKSIWINPHGRGKKKASDAAMN